MSSSGDLRNAWNLQTDLLSDWHSRHLLRSLYAAQESDCTTSELSISDVLARGTCGRWLSIVVAPGDDTDSSQPDAAEWSIYNEHSSTDRKFTILILSHAVCTAQDWTHSNQITQSLNQSTKSNQIKSINQSNQSKTVRQAYSDTKSQQNSTCSR